MRLLLFGSKDARIGRAEYLLRIAVYSSACAMLWIYHLSHGHGPVSEVCFFACCSIGAEWAWALKARLLDAGFGLLATLFIYVGSSAILVSLFNFGIVHGLTAFGFFVGEQGAVAFLPRGGCPGAASEK